MNRFPHNAHTKYHLSLLLFISYVFLSFPAEGVSKTFIDELGRKTILSSEPERIVSMAPNITEILFSLELGEKIVGVTDYCDYPPAALKKERIGGFINPSLEKIIALKPDIIICTADGNRKETVTQIEKLGFPVYVVHPVNMEGFFKTLTDIGEITGRKMESRKLVSQLREKQKRILALTEKLPKPKVFFQVGIDPIMTVGRKTFIDEFINIAGGQNIYGLEKTRYPRCSVEDVLTKDPAIIIVATMGGKENYERAKEYWQQWKKLQAVQNRQIHWIDPDIIDRFSPRIMDTLEELTGILHPDLRRKFPRNMH
jgi:iron complex transport system substrate-binding protein